MLIFHIVKQGDWHEAARRGTYAPASLRTEGFIHCSTLTQSVDSANRWFRGQRDLLLLSINAGRLAAELKYEPPANPDDPRRTERFPHIYGPLNLTAVVEVTEFPCDPDGLFRLPETLRAAP